MWVSLVRQWTFDRLLVSNPVDLEWDKGVPLQGKVHDYRQAMPDSRREAFEASLTETDDFIEYILEV